MKLSLNTDFTKLPKVAKIVPSAEAGGMASLDQIVLAHDERHLRRKVIQTENGQRIFIDLPEAVSLHHGDRLVLEDGGIVEIAAAAEELYDVRAGDAVHLSRLAWHLGNRHLPAQIDAHRILIQRDHVIKAMLEGLEATVTDVVERFHPVRGAYSGHGHHDHAHAGGDEHGHVSPGHGHHHHD